MSDGRGVADGTKKLRLCGTQFASRCDFIPKFIFPIFSGECKRLSVAPPTEKGKCFFMKKSSSKTSVKVLVNLCCTAILIALQVVLSRWLSISTPILKIGFSFVPVVIAARLFGVWGSVTVYALGDIIGALLFPVGAYFPGFTLSAAISGLIYGLFLKGKSNLPRAALAVGLNQLLCSFLLNSLWISITTGNPYLSLLATRWPQSLLMGVVQVIIIVVALERVCAPIEKSFNRFFGAVRKIEDTIMETE